jgi:hypothetical protein
MLHDIYYIIKPDILQQTIIVGTDSVIALEVDVADKDDSTHHFQLAEKYIADNPFCMLIHLNKTLTSEQATNLIAFLFFSNYNKPDGSPQIIAGGENIALIKSGIEQLQLTAKAQGFSNLHITLASALPTVYSSKDQSIIQETYKGWLQSTTLTPAPLYISVNQPADINLIREALEAEEAKFSQQNPGPYTLKMQNRALNKQLQHLELLCQAAQQEISNQVSHNQILRSSSQATALQNYYNNEYEVLPLWFKRLGHVVKALMGKRSFKSLYSDKVKKYKD